MQVFGHQLRPLTTSQASEVAHEAEGGGAVAAAQRAAESGEAYGGVHMCMCMCMCIHIHGMHMHIWHAHTYSLTGGAAKEKAVAALMRALGRHAAGESLRSEELAMLPPLRNPFSGLVKELYAQLAGDLDVGRAEVGRWLVQLVDRRFVSGDLSDCYWSIDTRSID